MSRTLVIGSRGSKLALWQAEHARTRLQQLNPEIDIRIEIIKTTGDVKKEPLSVIGGKGVFTKELEDALLDGRIDIAVHSLKDLPTILPSGLTISAICEREDARDALVLAAGSEFDATAIGNLPRGAIVGTSSPRRLAQLRCYFGQNLVIKDLRGNVDTRIRKLDEGEYDALILASAGLVRLGLHDRISLRIPISHMLPAVGQGAIAIETRSDDDLALETTSKLVHRETRLACLAERSFLRGLGGGCQLPIAAHARFEGELLKLEGLVAKPDGSKRLQESLSGPPETAEALGASLASTLIERGANTIL
ncbi:MAG TPA: hydroxymethylbilane synthase [Pyrinomonadaceae bacterium]